MSDPEPDSRADSQFGPCHLRQLLGRAGMGEVYEAEGALKERIVALKLLPQAISQDPEFREPMRQRQHLVEDPQGAVCRLMSVSTPREHA